MTENNDMEVSDTNASELINKVFDMPLQSYDDFISDFIYLTKDDVKQSNLPPNTSHNHINGQDTQLKPSESETELSEEHVGIGHRRKEFMMRNDSESLPSRIKFDNLVPLEDDLAIDDLDDLDEQPKLPTESITERIQKLNFEKDEDKMLTEDEKSTMEPKSIYHRKLPNQQSPLPGEVKSDANDTCTAESVEPTKTYLRLKSTNEDILKCSTDDEENMDSTKENENKMPANDVIPFSLDTTFDYDNVQLTPKFSESELSKK